MKRNKLFLRFNSSDDAGVISALKMGADAGFPVMNI